jgi:dolichyl-phosphate beta-glucosyltransferase
VSRSSQAGSTADLLLDDRPDGGRPDSGARDDAGAAVRTTGADTDPGPRVERRRRVWPVLLGGGLIYLALGFILWINAWADGATTHTLCGCGDPALFLWFFQWPATALAHGHNPFFSTALFHPGGINLLAQTSVTGLSLPLVPVTWIWGPVASLNVASTLTPALTAFFAFVVIRRWAPWTPAAFVGGLLYGFSPFVLTSLEFGHLMTAALMLLPLILAVLDEILVRQRHSALWSGVALGVLVFAQLFMSSEVLAICGLVTVICLIVLVVAAAILQPDELRRRAPHAARGLGVGLVVGGVLLAWPVWFALDGPAHLSGLLWKNLPLIGGVKVSNFVSSSTPTGGASLYLTLGGYEGTPLGSTVYLGWTLIGVLIVGVVAFWRDRKMWFFGFLLVLCFVLSIGPAHGSWLPASLLDRLPVVENVAVQRFMAVGYLAAAVLLALILFHVYELLPDWRGWLGALAVSAAALTPMATVFAPQLPYAMTRVILPRWYATVAPNLPPDRVLLSYPAPFSGIQAAMSWQAVNGMRYSQAGGGGPQGQASFAGSAASGLTVLSNLGFGIGVPLPTGTRAEYAAVRHALKVWHVTTVVVANNPTAPPLQQGHDPTYAAAFMTGALGRLPTVQAGAWVWNDVQGDVRPALQLGQNAIADCVARAEGRSGRVVVDLKAPACVGLHGLAAAGAAARGS